MAELIDETLVGFRLLDCVEVLALNVLDDRDFQRFDIVEIADEGGNLVEPRLLRRPPAPLAGDDLIALTEGADDDGLDEPARAYRFAKLGQPLFIELAARLMRMWVDARKGHPLHAATRRSRSEERTIGTDGVRNG